MTASAPRRRLAVADGGELAYDEAGDGAPIVLLHEGIADRRMWDADLPRLSRHHRVVRYDLRGYGGSAPASAPFSSVEDLRGVIDALGLPRPVVLGPSIGGRIAIDFALAHPTKLSALVLVAPGLSGWEPTQDPGEQAALAEDMRLSNAAQEAWMNGRTEPALEALRTLWASALEGAALDHFRTMVRANAKEIFEEVSARHDRPAERPAASRLGEIRVPVLVLVGDRDNPLCGYLGRRVAKAIPHARYVLVPGGDHVLNLSAPAAFATALDGFLSTVPTPDR